MIVLKFVAVVIVGYLLGSIPFGVLIGRHYAKVDVRAYGSGNLSALIIENYGNNIEPWLRPWSNDDTSIAVNHELEGIPLAALLLKNTIQTFTVLGSI